MKARNYGRIVNISSVAGRKAIPTFSAYSAAKAGVIGLTKSLGRQGTGRLRHRRQRHYPRDRQDPHPRHPERRVHPIHAEPHPAREVPSNVDEAAAMVAWLVSKENSFTTASVFDLSGGRCTY